MPNQHLLAENVFLDTEAFIRSRFNFIEGQLARLSKLAQMGRLRLLTTSITNREVARHLEKRVRETIEAARKDLQILKQSGIEIGSIPSVDEAIAKALLSFGDFLTRSRVVEVPLQADLEQLFDRYFALKAPFSEKKPKEFPDAVVAASLRAWCESAGRSAYVVSGDRDFDEVCAAAPYLFKVESVADVLNHASVSEDLHDDLADALRRSDELARQLRQEVIGFRAETSGATRYYAPGPISAEGRVTAARIDDIPIINVIDSHAPHYVCAITFAAEVDIFTEIVDRGELRWGEFKTTTLSKNCKFEAEVSVTYSAGHIEISSVVVDEEMINLDDEVDQF